eukprot:COSAG01_NODE_54216_length_333_cov_1.474359_1_plen_72_part_01
MRLQSEVHRAVTPPAHGSCTARRHRALRPGAPDATSTIMREVMTLSLGAHANFTNAHFWNFQDELAAVQSGG